jgi:putative membrane protein
MNKSHDINDKGQRLDKTSPLFIMIHVVIKSIIPLAFGVFTYGSSRYSNNLVIAATVFILAFSVLQYWFYHYWIKEDKIEIKEGILFKTNRKVPYTRIQNVNVLQNPLQRILNVATLQLESASGGKPEAVMRVVNLIVVEKVKSKVKNANISHIKMDDGAFNESDINKNKDSAEKNLLKLSTKDVIKYGIISQKGMFYGAILFGFMAQNQAIVAWMFKYLNIFYKVPDFSHITLAQGLIYVLVVGSIIFLFLQVMSILWALMKFYGFQLIKNEDRLHATMGLLSKVSATIPLKKIQLYRISENPIHKYFKARTITIETAGGVNTDKSGIVMRWLAPLINKTDVKEFMSEIEPKIKLGAVNWLLIPQRAWKRVLKRSLFTLLFFTLILVGIANLPKVSINQYSWIFIALLIPVIILYAKKYVQKTAYFMDDDIICFKSGVWFGKQSFVKISKIQTVEVLESPFDRRNKMATLEIDTAGSNPILHHVKIPYLEVEDAYKMRDFVINKLKSREFNW